MASFPITPPTTLAGFTDWVYNVMGVPPQYLPSDSPFITYAYNTAISIVNPYFRQIPGPIYQQMVYNLAAHWLVMWTPDVPGQTFIVVDTIPYGYFQYIRKQNNMLGFTTGIVNSSSDEGTSASMTVPKQAENLTLSQLNLTTSIWGRTYLGYAQSFGTNWGVN